MQEQQAIQEQTQQTKTRDIADTNRNWKRWLNYHAIVKQVPFCIFLGLLAVIYIYNGHYADKLIRNINSTEKEVKELQYEHKTLKSEVMFRSQQSELTKAVAPLGLKELTSSPVVLSNGTMKTANAANNADKN
jgi:hypothetical protein